MMGCRRSTGDAKLKWNKNLSVQTINVTLLFYFRLKFPEFPGPPLFSLVFAAALLELLSQSEKVTSGNKALKMLSVGISSLLFLFLFFMCFVMGFIAI
jgi:hypothetical protein